MTRLRPAGSGRRPRLLLLAALLGALSALMIVAPAAAQESAATASPIGGSVSGYGVAEWANLILRLALVLVVIWLAIVAMRWWVRRMNGGVGLTGGHLQVLETRSLGPNRSLQLVKLGNRAVLLGVTNERISSVLEIDDPIEVERLGRPQTADESPTSFRDAVSRLGSLTRWRPVIERRRAAPRTAAPVPVANTRARTAVSAPTSTAPRSRWLTIARRVIGLEDGPAPRRAVSREARPAAPAAQAPRSFAAASAAAAELPASRTARARSGYRQNQIAEAQRAIASVRAEMTR